jgi:hypothetical protein
VEVPITEGDGSGIIEALWDLIHSQEEGVVLLRSRVAAGEMSAETGDAIIAILESSNKHLRAYLWTREQEEADGQ